MERHPYFDLWLHDDTELATLLGSPVVERITLHEWPVSLVQRLRMASGEGYIYKVQAPPTVEPAFYAQARSPLLVRARVLGHDHGPPALLLEEVAAPRLIAQRPSEAEVLDIGRAVLTGITRIEGDLPAVIDIRDAAGWDAHVGAMLADLTALVEGGVFRSVDGEMISRLVRQAAGPPVREALRSDAGYVHGDLSANNLLVLPDDCRVIDWQRPLWGPVGLDLATLLISLDIDPVPFVGSGTVQLMYLLHIASLAAAARRWFPTAVAHYDQEITRLAGRLEQIGAS